MGKDNDRELTEDELVELRKMAHRIRRLALETEIGSWSYPRAAARMLDDIANDCSAAPLCEACESALGTTSDSEGVELCDDCATDLFNETSYPSVDPALR
jgi:hypothetical protein